MCVSNIWRFTPTGKLYAVTCFMFFAIINMQILT